MNKEKDCLTHYLDYLDREMTIMGILSTFCIITLGVATDRLVLSENDSIKIFWANTPVLCTTALVGLLFSALFFYRERALLAFYNGQISLYKAKGNDEEVKKYLDNSDSWKNWIYYQLGFGFLFIAICSLGAVLVSTKIPQITQHEVIVSITIVIFWSLIYAFKTISYKKFSNSENPEKDLWKSLFK